MNLKIVLLVLASVILLLLSGRCLGRPQWPGAGDYSKDRTEMIIEE